MERINKSATFLDAMMADLGELRTRRCWSG